MFERSPCHRETDVSTSLPTTRSAQSGSRPESMGTIITSSRPLISGCVNPLPSPSLSYPDISIVHGSWDSHLVTSRCCDTFGRHSPILTWRLCAGNQYNTGRRRLRDGARPHACHDPVHEHRSHPAFCRWIFGEHKIPAVQAERICPLAFDRYTVDSTFRWRKVALRCGACRPTCRSGDRAAGTLLHLTWSRIYQSASRPCAYSPLSDAKNRPLQRRTTDDDFGLHAMFFCSDLDIIHHIVLLIAHLHSLLRLCMVILTVFVLHLFMFMTSLLNLHDDDSSDGWASGLLIHESIETTL